jgi:hypothetical protein
MFQINSKYMKEQDKDFIKAQKIEEISKKYFHKLFLKNLDFCFNKN